jgi:hypothetical protein
MVFHAYRVFLPICRERERLQGKIGGPEPKGTQFRSNEHLSFFQEG